MSVAERIRETLMMELPATRNPPNFTRSEPAYTGASEYLHIGSEELNRLIDEDYLASRNWDDVEMCLTKYSDPFLSFNLPESPPEGMGTSPEIVQLDGPFVDDSDWDDGSNPLDCFSNAYSILVNPRTQEEVTQPLSLADLYKKPVPQVSPKPYHWSQDHDYMKRISEEDDDYSLEEASGLGIVEEIFKREDEPVVEVWEIDNFGKDLPATDPVPGPSTSYCQKVEKEPRRTSTRTAEIRRREQARKFSNAVHAVLKSKVQRTRQYKSIKPKNSVETTPSQSDIEEWYSQPVRPTFTKITKKKTTKGRIDHSESERHRREVLRTNFSSLCDLIPKELLRGEKASSQISKQKILNGAKAYILEINSTKSSYKSLYQHNKLLKEKWQKRHSAKLLKCVKKQK